MTDLADKSLRQDVISPEIMDIIITETVHLGNLRTGIDLLKTSVEQAETKNRTAVSRADVRASLTIVQTTLPPAVTRLLDEQEQQLLHAVAGIVGGTGGTKGTAGTGGTEKPMISGDVYNKLSETIPVCYSFFAKRMIKFSNMGLVKLERVRMWGNSRRILIQYGAGCTGCSSGASGAGGTGCAVGPGYASGASGTSRDLQNHG